MRDVLRLLGLFRPYRNWIAGGVALSVTVVLSNVALLALSGWFIAAMAIAGLGTQMIDTFTPAAAIRGLAIVRTLARYSERLVTHEATFRLLSELRVWFYRHLEPLAPARLQACRGGDLLSRIRADIDSLEKFYLRVLAPAIAAAVAAVLVVAAIALVDPKVALIDAGGLLLAGVALPGLALRLGRRPGRRLIETRAALQAAVADTCRGLGELMVYDAVRRQRAHVLALGEGLIAEQQRTAWITGISKALSGLVGHLAMWLALVAVIPLVTQHHLDRPDLAMVALGVLASFEAIAALPAAFYGFGETAAAARRLFEIVDARPAVAEPAHGRVPDRFDITVSGLRMRYTDGGPWALDRVNLTVPQGGALGVAGRSGAGKTTLFNILLRFWDFQDGRIEIGGVPLREIPGETLRGLTAVVAQRTHLFNTSIRENLRLARPGASEDELRAALQQAGVLDEVLAFPDGLDTVVGEMGARLSGGQARRLAIARAFLKDAPILLLDEPTEGLDAASEGVVLEALRHLRVGRTTLLISHRPRALNDVDQVIRLAGGQAETPSRNQPL
jgi:ATP-binding cassette, subfamily C, bacterial CydC